MEDQNQIQVQEKKSNKGIIILVIVLILIILGLVGYICYDKGIIGGKTTETEKTTKTEKEEKEEEKEVELTAEEQRKVNEIVTKLNSNFAKYYPISDLSRIPNQDLLRLASGELFDFNTMNTFTTSQVEEVVRKYFGNSLTVRHESIKCFDEEQVPMFAYNTSGYYSYNDKHAGHGGIGGKNAYEAYESGSKKGNIVTANYKIAYSNLCGDTCLIYQLFARYNDETPIYSTPDPENAHITKDMVNNYKDQLPTTTFTFEVSDGIYSLKSVKVN